MSTSTTPPAKPRNLGDVLQEFRQHRQVMQRELQKVIREELQELLEKTLALPFDPDKEKEFWRRRYNGVHPLTGRPLP